MIFEILKVTAAGNGPSVPTKNLDKTFQITAKVNPALDAAAYATAKAAALVAKVKIEVSNDGENWHTLYAEKTLTKLAAAEVISDYWPAAGAELWGYHRAVATQVDDGLFVGCFMCMEGR